VDARPVSSTDDVAILRSLILLTVVTGVIDAVSFLGLGHVFTANMTGNVVFLGFAAGGAPGMSPLRSIAALGAFACGSMWGGRVTNAQQRSPAGHLVIAMRVESVLLLVAAAAASIAPVHTFAAGAYSVIVGTAVAMGYRNAVVRRLAIPDLTTTVLTLTVTGLAADSRLAGGEGTRRGRRALSILAMFGGAVIGTALLRWTNTAVPLAVAAVVVVLDSMLLVSRLARRS
jgi:uncharacterized membrane protein YoaK (UPF0700 family)